MSAITGKINTSELLAVYRVAAANPDEFDQTARGYRGRDGRAMPFEAIAAQRAAARNSAAMIWKHRPGNQETFDAVRVGTRFYTVQDYAAAALGLTPGEADELFHYTNDLDRIAGLIRQFTGVDPRRPQDAEL